MAPIIRLSRPHCFTLVAVLLTATLGLPVLAATHYGILRSFGRPDRSEQSPYAPLTEGSDGFLYGTTYAGGLGGAGAAFKVNKDGSGYVVLHHFATITGDGRNSYSGLVEGSGGILYGATWAGGTNGAGTIFKLNKDGTGYAILHHFVMRSDGVNPPGALIQASDSFLYGTTQNGGSNSVGTVFRLQQDGTGFTVLHTFGASGDGGNPADTVLEASDGALYGVTYSGILYRLNKDGTGYSLVHSFQSSLQGTLPVGAVVEGRDGTLYGTTYQGGSNNFGVVFSVSKAGTNYLVLHHFGGPSAQDGGSPQAALKLGTNGVLYGTAEIGGSNNVGSVYALNQDGTSYSVLHHCDSGSGQNPYDTVLFASDGALYATAESGGSAGVGTVFRLTTDGSSYTVLHNFLPNTGGDGTGPDWVREARDGVLYGTTYFGGANGGGTVFKLNKSGTPYAILHNFSRAGQSESTPRGGMAEGPDGALYGIVSSGGTNLVRGGLFKLGKDGTGYTILRLFGSGMDGQSPLAGLITGTDGILYGTTYSGGTNGQGTVFAINTIGSFYQILHCFSNAGGEGLNPQSMLFEANDGYLYGGTWNSPGAGNPTAGAVKVSRDGSSWLVLHSFGTVPGDGARLQAGMTQGTDGAIYGATFAGGSNNVGAVFRVNSDSSGYQLIHIFTTSGADGQSPSGQLVRGWDGYLYGTTQGGGSNNLGTIFRSNNDGTDYSILHHFGSVPGDGANPFSLILGSDGAFYGAAYSGGAGNFGVVFRLLPPQTPDMLSVVPITNAVQVTFAGAAGFHYQLLRSTDIANWTTIATITMPAGGTYTALDAAPPNGRAFYTAAWVP